MGKDKITVSGTGCALADFLYTRVRFDSHEFQKYASREPGDGGLSPGRLVFVEDLERFAGKPYEHILAEIVNHQSYDAFNIGGPALVSLIHAAQLLNDPHFEVRFFGGMGNDPVADLIRSYLQKTPLDVDHYKTLEGRNTPFTDVLSDVTFDQGHGERSFINNIGAAWDYTPEMLTDSFFDSDIVCFGGTALVPQLHDHLTELLHRAKRHKCLTVVNTVFDFRNEQKDPDKPWPLGNTLESLKLTDLLIMDCEEALKISGQPSIERAAHYFSEQDPSAFIITNGSKDIYAFSNGRVFKPMKLSLFPVSQRVGADLRAGRISRGDTTGCGDNFAGGVIASMASQLQNRSPGSLDLTEALSWGVASGGFACFYLGGTWIEQVRGEKLQLVKTYQTAYLKQIERV